MSETNPTVLGVPKDMESSFVDHDLVVEPTQSDQIVRIGGPSPRPRDEVVDFQPESAVASVGGAAVAVAMDDRPS